MQDETYESLRIGIEIITSVAIILIAMAGVRIGRIGYNRVADKEAVVEVLGSMNKYYKYSGDISADAVINFIVTYGTQHCYIMNNGDQLETSSNITEKIISTLDDNGLVISENVNTGSIPLNSIELLEFFKDEIMTNQKLGLRAITLEGVEKDIKEADNCYIILIERK